MAKRILTAKKARWAKNRDVVLTGTILHNPVMVGHRYSKSLINLIDVMIKITDRKVKSIFKTEQAKKFFAKDESISSMMERIFNELINEFKVFFDQHTNRLVTKTAKEANNASKKAFKYSFKKLSGGLTIDVDKISEDEREIIKSIVFQNIRLVKSIQSKYLNNVAYKIISSIADKNNQGLEGLIKYIDGTLTDEARKIRNQAHNIALDQTRKMFNDFNRIMAIKAGIKQFRWIHTGRAKYPRPYHRDVLNDKIFLFDKPPIIDPKTKDRGFPGQLRNCRCTFVPVIDFDNKD